MGEATAEVDELPPTPVIIGTEAVLHRLHSSMLAGDGPAGSVVFLDFDAELSAPRYRATEAALALLARAARAVGGRGSGGRVIVQTRLPDHTVIDAARRADPGRIVATEAAVRSELGLPPATALAEVSGDCDRASALADLLRADPGLEVVGPVDGRWLLRAPNHRVLCDALARAGHPPGVVGGRLRIDVDPLRA